MTRALVPLLAILLLGGACAAPIPANAQRKTETRPMSDSPAQLEAEVQKALAEYDRTRAAAALQATVDALVREDGAPPADPASGLAMGKTRLRLWVEVLARFGRDIEPWFDPTHPPPASVAPPEIDGAQMMPGTKPSDIKDPAIRAAYEAKIAENARRVQAFTAMFRLHAIRGATLGRAGESLRDARDLLLLPAAEIAAGLADRRIAAADRAAVLAAVGN